jgi:hypothetical protein
LWAIVPRKARSGSTLMVPRMINGVKDLRHSRDLVNEYLCKMEMEMGLEGKAGGRKGGKVDAYLAVGLHA